MRRFVSLIGVKIKSVRSNVGMVYNSLNSAVLSIVTSIVTNIYVKKLLVLFWLDTF